MGNTRKPSNHKSFVYFYIRQKIVQVQTKIQKKKETYDIVNSLFTFSGICDSIINAFDNKGAFERIDHTSVAQWIEHCPPEAGAAVRSRPDVYFL